MRVKRSICSVILSAAALLTFACGSSSNDTEEIKASPVTAKVEVTGGTIEGADLDGILTFKGIPFAAPPVGDLRWKAPAPVVRWEGIKKTDSFCDACMQTPNSMGNTAPVSEDCLYLNVWTSAKMTDAKLPVIFWIHGGGYSGGSTSIPMYDGTGFAKKGAVMVSTAYRVGPFGFLAHPELSLESGHGSGTYAIQDMVYGLKWVKDNITKFGGDPDNVTIIGHSAGAAAISTLAGSPIAKGLFHKAICMSGGSFEPLQNEKPGAVMGMSGPTLEIAEAEGQEFIKRLGAADIKEARALSAEDIQKKLDEGMIGIKFAPAADGYALPDDLYKLYKAGNFNYTPVLLGHTSDEVGAFGPARVIKQKDFEMLAKMFFGEYADKFLAVYPHSTDEEATKSYKDIRNNSFSWNSWAWSSLQAEKGEKAFQYYFDFNPDSPEKGSGHGSDVPYVFQTLGSPEKAARPEELKLSDMMSSYWLNFAKTGDPNGEGLPEWPSYNNTENKVMIFDEAPGAQPLPELEKIKVYDGYIKGLREKNK